MPRFVDLSHEIRDGMVTYKGLPPPVICDYVSREESSVYYAADTSFHIGRIVMVANTGTYVDAPFHRFEEGADLAGMELERFADIPAVLFRAREREGRAIDVGFFSGREVEGKAVLIETGWSDNWGSERYFFGHPFLTRDAAQFLVDSGAKLVGIDSLNIDDTRDGHRPVHSILLEREIPIVEHMTNMAALTDEPCRFSAVPVKVRGCGSFPVRAYAVFE